MANLTVRELQSLTANDVGRQLSDGNSLFGVVRATATKGLVVDFTYIYKFGGRQDRTRIGAWPKLGLADIRRKRDELESVLRKGINPTAQRKALKLQVKADQAENLITQQRRLQEIAAQNARLTVRELFEKWQALELCARADKGAEALRAFERDVFPTLGAMAAADVSKADIQNVVDNIKARATEKQNMVRTAKKSAV